MVLWNVESGMLTFTEELCCWRNKLKLAREAHLSPVFLKAQVAGIILFALFFYLLVISLNLIFYSFYDQYWIILS